MKNQKEVRKMINEKQLQKFIDDMASWNLKQIEKEEQEKKQEKEKDEN